ncbi:hypothetical protein EYC84_001661 [Monilinia fructicola]|uniref:HhH-GPD domain-containing protein n=1 Tax=Monilinia fructicola TaxID=38448 RepID=A0A5M9JY62_MONFR|nr:hypothetical protein EYC84_001661 [Monilinia fructicola]
MSVHVNFLVNSRPESPLGLIWQKRSHHSKLGVTDYLKPFIISIQSSIKYLAYNSVIRLQRVLSFKTNPSLTRYCSLQSSRYFMMSTRRSARLSAASLISEKLSETASISISASPVAKVVDTINKNGSSAGSKDKFQNPGREKATSPETLLPSKDQDSKKGKTTLKEFSGSQSTKDASSSTPKRKKTSPLPPPSVTPTPAAVASMSSPHKDTNDASSPPVPVDRAAAINGTNAPLVTPETHQVVANESVNEVSPSEPPAVKISTSDILDKAVEHLIKVEPKLKALIERHPCRLFSAEGLAEEIEPFRALVSGIISQQVSGAAAKSIKAKFVALFNPPDSDSSAHTFPTPSAVVATEIPHLRTAGLSLRKAEYIHGLARQFTTGTLTTTFLLTAPYEEVLASLTKVRGIGKWSVEMFACFALKRIDVFSTGDLGVQRGMARLLGQDVEKLKKAGKGAKGGGKWKYMTEKEMQEMAEKFKPYRSIFMWYMWRIEDTDVSTLEEEDS